MKSMEQIKAEGRVALMEEYPGIGGACQVQFPGAKKMMFVMFTWNGGWDHVSVSYSSRCPTWDEMCYVKDLFFDPEEVCMQLHPKHSEYVNLHPYCLHIWRPQGYEMGTPPAEAV